MKIIRAIYLMIYIGWIAAGCTTWQSLSFHVVVEKALLSVVSPSSQSVPDMLIIASPAEIIPPAPGVQLTNVMLDSLSEVDFAQSFVVFHQVGQIPENGRINEIVRRGNTIRIKLQSYSVGPGNYAFREYTFPYQITVVEKSGTGWGEEMNFILEVDNGDVLAQAQHYIP